MRNLKKILALVLALVMSLSLMATASAAGTAAATDAATAYKTAVDVLTGLKVVIGDAGGIRENDPITRAEAATLIYRVHTADVTDSKVYLHTDHPFTDVASTSWMNSYVSYAHNAQIVKGKTTTTFDPTANITGYETLAMTLRALGYGKNGEFEGGEWKIQTAAWSQRIGLFNGISAADSTDYALNQPASRGFVFQVMFNAVLIDQVAYSAYTPDGYSSIGTTMAQGLGLEKITGVVMANEWADLESDSVLAEGKTRLDVDGKTYNLDISSELTDIGETRHAYVHGSTVLTALEDQGDNTVKDSKDLDRRGEGITVTKLRGDVKLDDNTQYFINFDDEADYVSEWRLEWSVTFDLAKTGAKEGEKLFASEYIDIAKNESALGVTRDTSVAGKATYTKVILRGAEITSKDIDVMRGIFSAADSIEGDSSLGIDGYVFAGTNSKDSVDRNKDLSDEMSWKAFYNEYINDGVLDITESVNGNWLKIVDNNQDGVAEYVFLTNFCMTTVKDWNAKTETWTFEDGVAPKASAINLVDGAELALNDVILYTKIDGVYHVSEPVPVKMTVASKGIDYKNKTLTGADGTVYDWSEIDHQAASYYDDVSYAVQGVGYDLYQDWFGFTRLFKESDSGFVLLTDGYFETDRRNDKYMAEIWNGDFQDVDVLNPTANPATYFISDKVQEGTTNETINGLDWDDEGTWGRLYRFGSTYYNSSRFNYGVADHNSGSHNGLPSGAGYTYRTNIASYLVDDDGAYTLSPAVDHRANALTHYNVFAIDVTNYTVKAKDQVLWGIETVNAAGTITGTQRINTTTDTIYYLVTGSGKDIEVDTWTGYSNAPSNYTVTRAYAVTSYVANTSLPYEVAEVVVIEATSDNSVPNAYLGISLEQRLFGDMQIGLNGLGYHPDTESWGLDTVTMGVSENNTLSARLKEENTGWPNETADMMYFYYADSDGKAVRILDNFDHYRIYAGVVVTSDWVDNRNYVQITKDGTRDADKDNSFFFPRNDSETYTVSYTKDPDNYMRTNYAVAYTNNFAMYERVIYMVDADGNVGFVVNVDRSTWTDDSGTKSIVPGLEALYNDITTDYNTTASADAPTVTFFGRTFTFNGQNLTDSVSYAEALAAEEAGNNKLVVDKNGTLSVFNGSHVSSNTQTLNAVNKSGNEVYTGVILGADGKTVYTFTLTQSARIGGFGNVISLDASRVQVVGHDHTGCGTTTPAHPDFNVIYDIKIEDSENLLISSLRELLDASHGCKIIGFKAYDSSNNLIIDTNVDKNTKVDCETAVWFEVEMENAAGEKSGPIWMYNDTTGLKTTVTVTINDYADGLIEAYWYYVDDKNNVPVPESAITMNGKNAEIEIVAGPSNMTDPSEIILVARTDGEWTSTARGSSDGWNATAGIYKWIMKVDDSDVTISFAPANGTRDLASKVKDVLESIDFLATYTGTDAENANAQVLAAIKSEIETELGKDAAALITGVASTNTRNLSTVSANDTSGIVSDFKVDVNGTAVTVYAVKFIHLFTDEELAVAVNTAIGDTYGLTADSISDEDDLVDAIEANMTVNDVTTGDDVVVDTCTVTFTNGTDDGDPTANDTYRVEWTVTYNGESVSGHTGITIES